MSKPKAPELFDFTGMDNQAGFQPQGKVYISNKPCHESHPDLHILNGTLVGGNCRHHDRHKKVDLYVALDGSMQHPIFDPALTFKRCVYYPIKNMGIPNNPEKFKILINTIVHYLMGGKKVHVGCIGGHGRTGMVLAAVAATASDMGLEVPEKDAIGWVRANYCKKAVETKAQEGFLVTHFGCKLPPAGKTPYEKSKGWR